MSWKETLETERLRGGERFTYDWYRQHTITREVASTGLIRGKLCDVACGIGRRAIVLAEDKNVQLHGIDYDEWAVEHARQECAARKLNAEFRAGSFYSLPFPDATFDVVLFLAAIEHAAFPLHALRELCRITAPGGSVIISVTLHDYHADPDHKSSFSEKGLVRLLSSFGSVKTWVSENIIYAVLQPLKVKSDSSRCRVIYAEMRHPDTYTEYWDDALAEKIALIPVSFGLDGQFEEGQRDYLLNQIENADVLHVGTGALALDRPTLELVRKRRPDLHISKWWGDVAPERYETECRQLSDIYDTMFVSVSNYIGKCDAACTQIHMNSPGVRADREAQIEFWQRPWDVGIFANAYSPERLARLQSFTPPGKWSSIWYGDGSPLGRISRTATNKLIGLCRINLNIVDPVHRNFRHWFSARVSNSLANGNIVLSSKVDCLETVLGDYVITPDDNASSWQIAIERIIETRDRYAIAAQSQRAIDFFERHLSYDASVELLLRAWGK